MANTDEETVAVVIKATQRVRYEQRRTIPLSVWHKYDAMCDAERIIDEEFNDAFEYLVDHSDFERDALEGFTLTIVSPPAASPVPQFGDGQL